MIALIGARGNSKRLPNKNLLEFCGKPLIQWTVEAALGANSISTIFVSTDSPDIATLCKSLGCEVPFMRPAELATDLSPSRDFIVDFLDKIETPPTITVLQPTSPLRTSKDIDDAVSLFNKSSASSVISVSEVSHPISWILQPTECGALKPLNINPQQLSGNHYMPNGAIYIHNVDFFLNHSSYLEGKTLPYIMDSYSSIDIDTIDDFKIAELFYNISL